MKLADKVELRVLGLARILCLVALVCIVLAMIVVVVSLLTPGHATANANLSVTANEVLSSIPGLESENDAIPDDASPSISVPRAAGLTVPKALLEMLTGDDANQASLDAWLGSVPFADRQQFLNELSDVVTEADRHAATWEWDDREHYIAAAMNRYAQVKIKRITSTQQAIEAANARSNQFRASLGTLLGLASVLTLLLLLSSIERNTRRFHATNEARPESKT
ncbi:hypothetical protein AB4Y36_35710 [Paraburkholderia sp. BR10936]|uniref:hypothetical protein n=1 Tax=Paraburkholderia sp. BR10936 TaxID=3236993 RepID=UPI0034D1531F